MQAGLFAQTLGMELLQPEMAQNEMAVEGCYIGDLLSNVMGNAKTGQLWMTVMTNMNVVAIAQLLELSGVVILEGNKPAIDVLERAVLEGIPFFSTDESAYEATIRFYKSTLTEP